MNSKELNKMIGNCCKEYRKNVLKISLTNFCEMNRDSIVNVSAFESGRANNIKYLLYYLNSDNKNILIENMFNKMGV